MTRPTRALLWCLLLVAASEVGLRALEHLAPTTGAIGLSERLVVLLGTSRSKHGLDPMVVEQVLIEGGVTDVFVGNASRVAATNTGLLQAWAEDVLRPVAGHGRGVVAIEVRIEGFNDNYQAGGEKVPTQLLESVGRDLAGLEQDDALDLALRWRLEDAAWWLLSRLRLTELPEILRRLRESREADPDDVARNLPMWARGERGYEPRHRRSVSWDLSRVREHYRTKVLANFVDGGRQTSALAELVGSVRAVGMTPVLYLMPVTADHKTVYPSGLWEQELAYIVAFAAAQGVTFVDLDAGHDLPRESFDDTSHLAPEGAEVVSRRLAERALVPLLR